MLLSLCVLPGTETSASQVNSMGFRAVWVSTVLNLDYPSKPTADAGVLMAECTSILDEVKSLGLNAVVLQVRPAADAFYRSDIFPWSVYLTGKAGAAPNGDFDPLSYWVEEAHKRGIELHAWINPYRITKKQGGADPQISDLPDGHPAKLHPDWVVRGSDGDLYFDPGIPEVRQLIVDGAVEIAQNYDVDGIHMDDYFYPSTDFDDADTYARYGKSYSSIDNWRRSNTDALVRELDTALHECRSDIRFGISPFGIWANKKTVSQGSDTNGGESYTQNYADTRKWVKLGWVDYIAPQIYWEIGHKTADYATLVKWWAQTVSGTGVDLYIGHSVYRVGAEGQSKAWATAKEVQRQLDLNTKYPEVRGSIFFRYQNFKQCADLETTVRQYYKDNAAYLEGGAAAAGTYSPAISRPESDVTTTLSSYYIGGSSDSSQTLYLNGEPVFERSSEGFWGKLVSLSVGKNVFTVTQGDETHTRTITRKKASAAQSTPAAMSKAEVLSAYPSATVYFKPGQAVTLQCEAPIGAKVSVKFNGKTLSMTAADKKAPDSKKIYKTTYTCTYTIPKNASGDALSSFGSPTYAMTYKGKSVKKTAAGSVLLFRTDAAVYAELTSDAVSAYSRATSSGGPVIELYLGMKDRAVDLSGSYVKLGVGLWVSLSNVKLTAQKSAADSAVRSASYEVGADGWERLTLSLPNGAAGTAFYDDGTGLLTFTASPASAAPAVALPDGAVFSSVTGKTENGCAVYTLKPAEDGALGGYYVEKTDGGLVLCARRKLAAKSGPWPLSGHTIMVDPGHGGSDTGALGLLGSEVPEKDINLKNAFALKEQLESLGATVIMTRTEDTTVELADRLALSRKYKPDLFISVHANSMNEDVDCSKVSGFTVYYREDISSAAAKTVYNYEKSNLGLGDKGVHQSNLYVCRGDWTPALIVEAAFMPNPYDFEWLLDDSNVDRLARTLALSVVEYFSR